MPKSHVRAPVLWQTDHSLARVATLLKVPAVHAYGLVTALSGYMMERHKHGELRKIPSSEIEHAVQWDGEAGQFASVMLDNYVDGRGVLRDWEETAAPILREREANSARVARFRERMKDDQTRRADAFIQSRSNGTGGNGSASLDSASPSDVVANSHRVAPPPARPASRKSDRTATGARLNGSVTGDVTGDTSSRRDVTRDAPGSPTASSASATTSDSPHLSTSSNVESVMRDSNALHSDVEKSSVMRDVTRYSRAVVQDLDQEKDQDQEQRSLRTDGLNTATISLEQANLSAKINALTSALVGIPVERVAEALNEISVGRDALDEWSCGKVRETITRFLHKFYGEAPTVRLSEIVNEMLLVMTHEGIESPGGAGRIAQVRARSLLTAMTETITRPPRSAAAAWAYTLRKLQSGRANLELTADGTTVTEKTSERLKRVDSQIAPAIRSTIDSMTGTLMGRKMTTTKADEQRTALRWLRGETTVRQELAEACEQNFASWDQTLPGLDAVKENWIKSEALNRWRSAGRPLPMPPR